MKKVMAFGSFDLFHKGHEHYLKEAKSFGDFLTVIVSRDVNIQRLKNHEAMFSEEERIRKVFKNKDVDEALLGYRNDLLKIVVEEKPDILCLGHDQKVSEEWLKNELEKRGFKGFKIVRAKGYKPEIYKSSLLKKKKIS